MKRLVFLVVGLVAACDGCKRDGSSRPEDDGRLSGIRSAAFSGT